MSTVRIEFEVPDETAFMFCTLDYMKRENGKWEYEVQEKYTAEIQRINASTNEN